MLKDIFFTAIIVFVLFKVFGNHKKNNKSHKNPFQGNSKSQHKADKNSDEEFTEYEEIK